MLASPQLANAMALICMLRSFLLIDGTPNEDRLASLEDVTRMLHNILEHVGCSPHLRSLTELWECASKTLRLFETELFPEDEAQTPNELTMPPMPRPLSALSDPLWVMHRPEIRRGWNSLKTLRVFFAHRYDEDLHLQAFQLLDDVKLIIQTVGFIIGETLD